MRRILSHAASIASGLVGSSLFFKVASRECAAHKSTRTALREFYQSDARDAT
jgi:hypothetical protein